MWVRAFMFSKAAYFVIGVALGIGVNALSIPQKALEFEEHLADAKQYLSRNLYQTSQWTGIFDAFPEGVVDVNDMDISSAVEAALEIEVADGNLTEGRIWWNGSCSLGMPYQGILIEGRIRMGGSRANVQIYDFIGGRRVLFMSGQLKNDGLIIEFTDFPEKSGLNGSRVAQNPEPATLENWSNLYCEEFVNLIKNSPLFRNGQSPQN